ncbi:Nephrocystin-1, partial [Stegodyphus mimosarum]
MCHHDGHKVLSNIHTVKAKWDARTPNLWTFNSKVSTESSLEEGQIFIRSDKCFATSGIFFELCISQKKENSEVVEMSCGWAYMNLFDDMGKPINSRYQTLSFILFQEL